MAVKTHKAQLKHLEGLTLEASARNHKIIIDEPKTAGGADEGMTPVEALLSSLGACKMIVAYSFAKAQKIQLNKLSIEVEGDLDSDGYLEKNPDAKVGFINIHTTYNIDADNTEDEIADFVHFVETHCPVNATILESPEMTNQINLN